VQHKDELVLVREIIEKLKAYYHDAAIGSANSIDISKEMHAVNFNFAIPQSVLFYLYGASKSAQYLPIAIDFDRIGNAFMPAIEGFYKVYGEEPTPQKRSSVKLAGVSLIVNDNEVPIDNSKLGAMWDLFREMTTFDSDTYEIEQFRKRFLSSQTAN
jgi:hypothetical protein